MKLIKKGAEGDLYQTNWNSKKSILKIRKAKDYRNSELDLRIRKQRTIRESEIIQQVKSFGVATPIVFFVDTKQCSIMMQYLHGTPGHDISGTKFIQHSKDFGKIVGTLHKNGIMHGDLTTSNFIVSTKKIFIIDFGLAIRTSKPEDHAVDLRLFKEILNSAHVNEMPKAWPNFLSGYKSVIGQIQFNKIINLVSVIESRGRYANVV